MKTESGESHDAVLDRISDRFFELDQGWRFTRFNKSAEAQLRILGLNPAKVLGQVLWDVFPNPTAGDALRRAMAERETVTHEGFSRPLGRWVENRICPTSDGGLVIFQHFTRTAGRGVWNLVTGEMIWSPETFRIYGFDPATTTPSMELLFGIVHPADRAAVAEAVETIVRERSTFDVRFRVVTHGVTKHIHCFGRAVVDEADVLLEVLATIEDVTTPPPAIADAPDPLDAMDLSQRQEEVLRDCASGYANQDIATRLGISVRTVEVHKTRGMRKQNMHGRRDVVRYALLHGWLQDG